MPNRLINVDEIIKSDGTPWEGGITQPYGEVMVEGQCWGANHQPFAWNNDITTALAYYDPNNNYFTKLLTAATHTITWEWEHISGDKYRLEIANVAVNHTNINAGTNDIYDFTKTTSTNQGTVWKILDDPGGFLKKVWWSPTINSPFPNDLANLEYNVSSGSSASGGVDNYEYNASSNLRLRSDRYFTWGWGGMFYRGQVTGHSGTSFSDWCSSNKGYNGRFWSRLSSFAGHQVYGGCYPNNEQNVYRQHYTNNTDWVNFKIYVK